MVRLDQTRFSRSGGLPLCLLEDDKARAVWNAVEQNLLRHLDYDLLALESRFIEGVTKVAFAIAIPPTIRGPCGRG